MSVEHLGNLIVAGLMTGSIYGLLAVSYNTIFATAGILNIAQGDLFMAGGMIGVFLFVSLGWPVLLALVVTVLIVGLLAALEDVIAVRPALARSDHAFGWLVSTLGFAIALRAIIGLRMGTEERAFPSLVSDDPWHLGPLLIVPQQLLVLGILLTMGILLSLLYRKTLFGKALAAIAQDRDAAAIRGVPVKLLSTFSFFLGGAIVGLSGFVSAPITTASVGIGFALALKGFVAAALGGIPEIRGAVVGGLVLGVIEVVGADVIGAAYRNTLVFAVLLLVLVTRPTGLLGRAAIRRV